MIFAVVDFFTIVKAAGGLSVVLGILSFVEIFIICERAVALRKKAIIPQDLVDAALQGKFQQDMTFDDKTSALGRIINFVEQHPGDVDGAKAYARLEVIKMERGVSYLDVIYTGAPLLGLIGTVFGLLSAFNVIDPETRMPDPVQFTHSVGLALSATLIGLVVALVALGGNGYLQRKIDHHAARLDVLLERILAQKNSPASATEKELVQ
ncbi:MAG: MotA/TolQ/ExbB proton channel family protein [Verrucomicrobia bacterium]|nr:MotA/TolQ/ExbB proton channel family protein [Verrucomicrobiota bacterium]